MGVVRWGLLSTANINRALVPAIRASTRGELVAVASRSKTSAEDYAAKWEIPQSFGSYDEMLKSDSIDAVYIGLPNHLHAEWSIRAMELGKHVLCEKPFALSLDEVDAMISASRKYGRVITEAFMYRHHPQTKLVGEWAHGGKIGDLISVRGVFNFYLANPDNVRLVPEYGGGCLWDVGVYPLSLAQFIFKSIPKSVFGQQWLGEMGVDMAFAGQMIYPSGGISQIFSSFKSAYHTYAEIIGTNGRLEINHPFLGMAGQRMLYYPIDGKPVTIDIPDVELYSGEVEDLQASILDGTPSYLSLDETRSHIKTVLALYESARSQSPQELD